MPLGATTLLANSASAALTVTQTGAGASLVVDTTALVVDAAGNVGIGIASPTQVFEVRDQANGANFIVGGSGTLNVTRIAAGAADAD